MKNIFFAGLLIAALFSCSKDDGSQSSKINITKIMINGETITESSEEPVLHTGDELKVDVAYTSNLNTTQLKVEIHHNFDGHQHEHDHAKLLIEAEKDTLRYSNVIELGDKEGSVTVYNQAITEKTAEGEYHLEVIILDEEGGSFENIYAFEIHEEHGEHEEHENHEEHIEEAHAVE